MNSSISKDKTLNMVGGGMKLIEGENARYPYYKGYAYNYNTTNNNDDYKHNNSNSNTNSIDNISEYIRKQALKLKSQLKTKRRNINITPNYERNIGDDRVRFYFSPGRTTSDMCFVLSIDPTGKAELKSLEQSDDCAVKPEEIGEHVGIGTGKKLLLAAYNLAVKKGATSFTFSDNSKKEVNSGVEFTLSDMYFLTKGVTWYESIIPGLRPTDKYYHVIEEYRKIVKTNTWADVASRLPSDVKITTDISMYDINAPGSAMMVLNEIKNHQPEFFPLYTNTLVSASNIKTLEASVWTADIPPR